MDVLTAAWVGAGSPTPHTATLVGECSHCGAHDHLVSVRAVVSKQFTGFDGWANPSGRGVCPGCAWGYSTTELRAGAHLITRDPATLTPLDRACVAGVLRSGPIGSGQALVVPLRPGRKHLLPAAVWGRVSVEDVDLAWGDQEVGRLREVDQLRALGFGSRMLIAAAPPFQVMKHLTREQFLQVLQAWAQLEPWRQPGNPWMALAVHITTPTTTKESQR